MMLEEKIADLHLRAKSLAFSCYLRRGRVPAFLCNIIEASASVEAMIKFNPYHVPAGNQDGGQFTTPEGAAGGDTMDDEQSAADAGAIPPSLVSKPASNTSVSPEGIDFLIRRESFRSSTYSDTAGKPTIGYGHLLQPGESYPDGITQNEARQLFTNDLRTAVLAVQKYVTVPLTQPQFDALTALTYNIGGTAFKTSTLLRLLNQGNYNGAANQFLAWNKIRNEQGSLVPDKGLTNRRHAERNVFLSGKYL